MHFSYQNFKQFDVTSLEYPCLTVENQIVTQVMSFVVTLLVSTSLFQCHILLEILPQLSLVSVSLRGLKDRFFMYTVCCHPYLKEGGND